MSNARLQFAAASAPYISLNEIAAMVGLRTSLPLAVDKKMTTELLAKADGEMRESLVLSPTEDGFRLDIHLKGAESNPVMGMSFEEGGHGQYSVGSAFITRITDNLQYRPVLNCAMIDNVARMAEREVSISYQSTIPRIG